MYGGKRASQPLLGMICCQPGVCLTWVSTDPHWRGNVWWVLHNCPAWQFMMGLLVWLGRAWLGLACYELSIFPTRKKPDFKWGEQSRGEQRGRADSQPENPTPLIWLEGGRSIPTPRTVYLQWGLFVPYILEREGRGKEEEEEEEEKEKKERSHRERTGSPGEVGAVVPSQGENKGKKMPSKAT